MSILHTNKNKKPPKKTPERIEKIFQSFLKQNPNYNRIKLQQSF